MKLKQLSIAAALGLCCIVNAQDALLADALFTQGEIKLKQAKTEDEFKEVFNLMKKAAESGSQKGNLFLGKLYFEGKGTERDVQKAIQCWTLANKPCKEYPEGLAEAKYYLGLELFQRAVKTNEENSLMVDLLTKAGEMGCTEAWACLGKLYWNGNGFHPEDKEKSKESYLKAELLKPEAEYEYWIGCNYLFRGLQKKQDFISGLYWLNLSANKGYLQAHAKLGLHYLDVKDLEKANVHLEKAIPLKDLEAITALNALRVIRYEKRYEKLSPNAKKIVQRWLSRARSGDQVAALTLGKYFQLRSIFASGIDFDNAAQGFFFMQYAAGLGSRPAQRLIKAQSIQALKVKEDNQFTSWHKLSGEKLVKEFADLYGGVISSGILGKNAEISTDFLLAGYRQPLVFCREVFYCLVVLAQQREATSRLPSFVVCCPLSGAAIVSDLFLLYFF